MQDLTRTSSTQVPKTMLSFIASVLKKVSEADARYRSAHHLALLSDEYLADMGITRKQAGTAFAVRRS